jgi:hypothetical protein
LGEEFNEIANQSTKNVVRFYGPTKNARFRAFWTDIEKLGQNRSPEMDELKSRELHLLDQNSVFPTYENTWSMLVEATSLLKATTIPNMSPSDLYDLY